MTEPHIVKLWAWGGITNCHDYLMSDGSIQTINGDKAIEMRQRRADQLKYGSLLKGATNDRR